MQGFVDSVIGIQVIVSEWLPIVSRLDKQKKIHMIADPSEPRRYFVSQEYYDKLKETIDNANE